ncbi:MAG: asparagine synthase (glutamine-hydrolyzing) [Chloroflexi bacterium]|nr:asparagine synthase (glutamine-hydrolyzing) [Chloroflexota bacterium]
MCGIAGIVSLNRRPIEPYSIKSMCDVVAYRGPDDAGYVLVSLGNGREKSGNLRIELTDNDFKHKNVHLTSIESDYAKREIEDNRWHLALGHRRLAVIDLTPKAHQPMSDRNKSIWITYNGEVYNFKELRAELENAGYEFFSNSDTEVIINSYKHWGINCIHKFNGMFAFSLWDNQRGKLFLVRDRYGIKPLYYYFKDGILAFASEIKSILQSGLVKAEIDLEALNEYFTFQNIFTNRTLFKDIRLLPPGSYAELNLSLVQPANLQITQYWDYKFSPDGFKLSQAKAAEEIRHLFIQAVTRQLVSDVPVGSYLSGGMDTGSITAIARKHLGRISTFTCGFDLSSASGLELGYDERQFAEFLANLLKSEHYEVVLHAGDMEHVTPELIWHLEDLRMGQSYPNYYAARLAGKFVKVVLSGAGGDELFGGYPWRYYRGINPKDMSDYLRRYYDYWQRLVADEDKSDFLKPEVYQEVKGHPTFDIFSSIFAQNNADPRTNEDYINGSMYLEIKTFLHGLFVVEDKISMAHSLETRVPFLDNDLVDFALKLPVSFKLSNLDKILAMDEDDAIGKYYQTIRDGKKVLRQAMRELMPKEILERGKQGFSAPDASWFRGESIDYIKQLLLDPKARIYDYLNPDYVQRRLEEHISGKSNHRLFIWSLLSFEWWNRIFLNSAAMDA